MKLVKVKPSFYNDCTAHGTDQELMFNECGRPCVLIVKLRYKGTIQDFVVPLRSNISQKTPKNQYFSLPPNSKTRTGNSHGVHYIKLFPVNSQYIDNYLIAGDTYMALISKILNANEKTIVAECQKYLTQVENGNKHYMTPDIDGILSWL